MREEVRVRRCGRRSCRLGRVLRPRGCFVGCAPFILEPLQPFRPRARLREFEARLCLDRARRSRRRRWRLQRQRRSHVESKRPEGRPATRPCTRECRLNSTSDEYSFFSDDETGPRQLSISQYRRGRCDGDPESVVVPVRERGGLAFSARAVAGVRRRRGRAPRANRAPQQRVRFLPGRVGRLVPV